MWVKLTQAKTASLIGRTNLPNLFVKISSVVGVAFSSRQTFSEIATKTIAVTLCVWSLTGWNIGTKSIEAQVVLTIEATVVV